MYRMKDSIDGFALLSFLALCDGPLPAEIANAAGHCDEADLALLLEGARNHHVVLRAFPLLQRAMLAHRNPLATRVQELIAAECGRIHHAANFLSEICRELAGIGDVVVIKSLDHWPDLGNDLDLFTNGRPADLISIMRDRFHAQLEKQSWGDRLANKWNFQVPGLPELVEVHVGRLGQTGEQIAVTNSLVARARTVTLGNHQFRVPGAEEQIIISTLQRMYRHFYLRLCDIVNIAAVMDSGALDYEYLESLATSAGLWDGLATYLGIIARSVEKYRGHAPDLPRSVVEAARFGADHVGYRHKFLRIPIFPQAASLYAREWSRLAFDGQIENTLRLSLLPGLAMAALVAAKISGTDKGIW